MKLLLISNMYPSKEDVFLGIFVKNFENKLIDDKFVITCHAKSKIQEVENYIIFISLLLMGISCTGGHILASGTAGFLIAIVLSCTNFKEKIIETISNK